MGGRRIAIGMFMQESNSFSPLATNVATFEGYRFLRGAELLADSTAGGLTELEGFVSTLRAAGAVPVPLLAASALAGGPLVESAFEGILSEMIERLRAARPVDGVLLALHGALMVEGYAEGGDVEILRRVRSELPVGTPIGVTLDLHAHVTRNFLQPDCFFVGYQEYPHTDMYETGKRAARLILETLSGKRKPRMSLAKRPMVISAAYARTTDGALAPVAAAARAAEGSPGVLHASIFPVQPWLDVADLGFAVLTCADGPARPGKDVAEELANLAWSVRHGFEPDAMSLDEAIRIGLSSAGLTVVSDSGDCPSGGSPADSPAVLRRLLSLGAPAAERLIYLSLCDPQAVDLAFSVAPGQEVSVSLGNYYSKGSGAPLSVRARVLSKSDGRYRMRDQALDMAMGRTVVLAIGALRILVRSFPSFEWDAGMYLSQGLRLADAALVFVKSPGGFRHSYGKDAARILVAETPGPTQVNVRRVPYMRVTRPLFPLDNI